jgi:flagellar basal-body rod protein FlgB
MSWLVDPTMGILAGALDGLSQREGLIASNLANIDTPGYRPVSLDFESTLRSAMASQGMNTGQTTSSSIGNMLPPSSGPSAAIALQTTDSRQYAGGVTATGSAPASQTFDGSLRNDGNTVDLESELTALVDTQVRYGAVSELVTGKLAMLHDAIGGR